MRKILLAGLILPGLYADAQKTMLKGELKNISEPVEKVFLQYHVGENMVTDTTVVSNGKYQFSIKLEEPTLAYIIAGYRGGARYSPGKMFAPIFLDMKPMTVVQTDSFSNAKINGSKANDEYKKLTESLKPINKQREALILDYKRFAAEGNKGAQERIEKQIDSLDDVRTKSLGDYVAQNPSSPIATPILQEFAGSRLELSKVEPLFNKLSQEARNTPTGKHLKEAIETAKKTGIGQMAIDFTQNDTLGNPVKLSSFRGKYVLLDFWASWCGPCRAENPNVVNAYSAYNKKGFEVLSVSLDRENGKEKWLKAIHDDHLTWTHVSDLKFWNNAVAKAYGIQAIPQNLLLDPQGKIIGKNLRGEELQKKLAEIFN